APTRARCSSCGRSSRPASRWPRSATAPGPSSRPTWSRAAPCPRGPASAPPARTPGGAGSPRRSTPAAAWSPAASPTTCRPSMPRSSRSSPRAPTPSRPRPWPAPSGAERAGVAPPIAVLDVDGTLVDTNYHHAIAWYRAFREHGLTMPVWRIHRHIGMGGDQLVAAVAGKRVEDRQGDSIRAAEAALYADLIGEGEPFPDAPRLLELLGDPGHPLGPA